MHSIGRAHRAWGSDQSLKRSHGRVLWAIYTQSSFKRNGNKRNEYLGVRKKRSTHFLGVRNAILAGGAKKKEETAPRRLKY
jgi:hypothetical protein